MEKIYSVKDVQKFLFSKGVVWTGKLREESIAYLLGMVPAKVYRLTDKKELELFFDVSNIKFDVYSEKVLDYKKMDISKYYLKDLLGDWVRYLAHNYPEKAGEIKELLELKKQGVHHYIGKELAPFEEQIKAIKQKEINEINYYDNLETIVDKETENEKE